MGMAGRTDRVIAVGIRTFSPLERWRAEQALHDPSPVVPPFLAGGGEAGALVRAHSIGPPHPWAPRTRGPPA
jgi:hypothetical protein